MITNCTLLKQVPGIYDAVHLTIKRARQLSEGAPPLVEPGRDKVAVIAMREIAAKLVTPENIDTILERSIFMSEEDPEEENEE